MPMAPVSAPLEIHAQPWTPQEPRVGYVPTTSPALRARDYKGTPQDVQEPAFVSYAIQERATSTNPTAGTNQNQQYGVRQGMQVRRLTPEECEKLQGFPVGHTRISWHGKAAEDCPDGPRYKALGNSMAVPCMAWIAKRIIRHIAGEI